MERVVQSYSFLFLLVKAGNQTQLRTKGKESRVKYLLLFLQTGLIGLRLLHTDIGVKPDPKWSATLDIDIQHIVPCHNLGEGAGVIAVALHVVDAVVLPLVAAAGDLHILLHPGARDHVLPDGTAGQLVLVESPGHEVPEFRILQPLLFVGQLDGDAEDPVSGIFGPDAEPEVGRILGVGE